MNDSLIAPTTTTEPATTETAAMADLVAWSEDCPLWQRDALRRLCAQDQLTDADLDALIAICRGDAQTAVPLAREHVRDPASSRATVILRQIHDVQYVNALAVGEHLTFEKKGVTIIYGDNGSGKSGYARVLKRVCRSRLARDENILSNIYSSIIGDPTAAIDFSVNGQNRTTNWVLDQATDPVLSAVSVFDSRTANVHVDQTNDVAYTPLPLKVLAALAQTCQDIKQRINADIKVLKQHTPASISKPLYPATTQAGKLIAELTAKTKPGAITALATLSAAEKTRLAVLSADLASDPVRTARHLQASKRTIDGLIVRLERLAAGLADTRIEALYSAYRSWKTAEDAAHAASDILFSDQPLPEIGSDTWRALWEAARAYSQTAAYPSLPFPVTTDEARCLLCQQELSPAAADRFNRFEGFVKEESKNREETARAGYELALYGIQELRVSRTQRVTNLAFIRDEIGDDVLADAIRRSFIAALWRLRHVIKNHAEDSYRVPPALRPFPIDALRSHGEDLEARATAFLAQSDSTERKALVVARDELAAREWLAVIKDDVMAEIGRRTEIASLEAVLKDTTTKSHHQ